MKNMLGMQAAYPAKAVLAYIARHLRTALVLFNQRVTLRAITQLDCAEVILPFLQLILYNTFTIIAVESLPAIAADFLLAFRAS